jgi:beta-lactamase regulating signal transducer with metallopeptidase domain
MNFINELFSERLVQALGWTILHSFWQGAVVALLLALAMIGLRRNSSGVRYFVSATALFTMMALWAITFVTHYQSYSESISADAQEVPAPEQIAEEIIVAVTETTTQNATWGDYFAYFGNYFEQHLPLIVCVWAMGIVILLLRFLGAYSYLQRLKHYKTFAVSEYWQTTTQLLATQLKIRRAVRLLESAMIQVPMVIGHLKPVILLPLGTLTGLSQHQVESILAHELAHIRRNDYLVNLFQSVVEIILFYNPFIWWISGIIQEERENCADDIAVSLTGDSLTLVKTLATLEELRLSTPQFAMALSGRKSGLLHRIQRLLRPRSTQPTFGEGFLSAFVLIFCLTIATVNAHTPYNWNTMVANPLTTLKDNIVEKVNEFFALPSVQLVKAQQQAEEVEDKLDAYEAVLDELK